MRAKVFCLAAIVLMLTAIDPALAREPLSDAQIRQQIIDEGVAAYHATGLRVSLRFSTQRLKLWQAQRLQQAGWSVCRLLSVPSRIVLELLMTHPAQYR